MMRRRDKSELVRAQEAVGDFAMTENLSRSFEFRHKSGSSTYFHTLTWSPGVLTLFGDTGELVLRHWSALQHFESGMSWAAESDVHYLLEKSDKSRVLDVDASLEYLIQSANEEPVRAMWGYVSRWWRVDKSTGVHTEDVRRVKGAMHEMRSWRALPEDERDCLPDVLQPFTPKVVSDFLCRLGEGDGWSVDEAWSRWFRLWQHLSNQGYVFSTDPNMIRRADGRRELKEALAAVASNEPHEFVNFLAGLDWDYYGTNDYTRNDRFRIEIIRIGARRILDEIVNCRAKTASVADGSPIGARMDA